MTKEDTLSLDNTVMDGATIYKIYTSTQEFLADRASFAEGYRVIIFAEDDANSFLKKHALPYDPATVCVVSYTKIIKNSRVQDPFSFPELL